MRVARRRSWWLAVLMLGIGVVVPAPLGAQEVDAAPEYEAVVTDVVHEGQRDVGGELHEYQVLELRLVSGPRAGETVAIETGGASSARVPRYAVGERLLVSPQVDAAGVEVFYIADRVRLLPLGVLFALFVGLSVLVGRWRGLMSLLAMTVSFGVIFLYLLPRVSAGADPIRTAITASLVMIPVTFYLSHGFNRKTTAAVIGTLISLVATGVLAQVFVDAATITGFASEDAAYLQSMRPGIVNIRGLLLAGIIIGLTGVLDDITVAQSAIVTQLRAAAPELRARDLYRRAMDVGRDHIASMVNTLVMVYASTAMPLLLLFLYSAAPLKHVVSYEIVAEEIVRTLVASSGLILAVPVATAIAAVMACRAEPAGPPPGAVAEGGE